MKLEELNKLIRETLSDIGNEQPLNENHPGCNCPAVGGNAAYYRSWAECTSGPGGVAGCEGCCQGGVLHAPDVGDRTISNTPSNNNNKRKTISMKENKTIKNKKTMLNERFQELAGIKPLYKEEKEETTKEYSYEEIKDMMMNEQGEIINEQLFTALGGLAAVLGAAGVTASIEMALEDPAIAEKYPKLAKVFEFLGKIGGALGKGIK